MKIIVAAEELPMCASRASREEAIRRHVSKPLKRASQPHKASKIQIEFAEEKQHALHVFPRPHFMGMNMLDDQDMCFVGIPALWKKIYFAAEIEKDMKLQRCHPVFVLRTAYADMIEEILKRNTYESVQTNLNHAELFEEYVEYNRRYFEKILEIYEQDDVVWIMDHNLLLLPQMLGNIPSGISFNISFSTLFKCIPFWTRLLQSILHCRYIEFLDNASRDSFDLLVAQKTQIVVDATPFKNLNPPATGVNKRGIEKNVTLKNVSKTSHPAILVPFDSAPHLLGIEAYLSKYNKKTTILLLTSRISNVERHAEISRLREYLEINYDAQIQPFVPTSDEEFYSVLKSCTICHCPEAADVCAYLGVPVIEANPYDFREVAEEIDAKMKNPGSNISTIPSRQEWKSHFMKNMNINTNCASTKTKIEIDAENREDEHVREVVDAFRRSKTRTLVLDYDGTLTDIVAHPDMAAPTNEIKKLLVDLAKTCRLVISTGRSKSSADAFFPKEIEVFAEHGACHRVHGEWTVQPAFKMKNFAWRIADFFAERTPGAELEAKETGFSFHFRNVSPLIATKQASALFEILKRACGDHAKEGDCIIEVRSSMKSAAMESVKEGFVLCAGDDVADEEMLRICPGYTVKIGSRRTCAQYTIRNPQGFRKLLSRLLE